VCGCKDPTATRWWVKGECCSRPAAAVEAVRDQARKLSNVQAGTDKPITNLEAAGTARVEAEECSAVG
jgi:hypothetical protein